MTHNTYPSSADLVYRVEAAHEEARKYRTAALLFVAVSFLLTVGLFYVGRVNVRLAEEVAVYDKRCVDAELAEQILAAAERTSEVNNLCVDAHNKRRKVFEQMLPTLSTVYQDHNNGGSDDNGSGYFDEHQDMSTLPEYQGIGGVLSGAAP